LKWISQRLKQNVTEKGKGKRVRVPGILEFIATADSEASDAKSPGLKMLQVLRLQQMLLAG